MRDERKPLQELTDEEIDRRIVFSCLDDIAKDADRMTSGNFMHNRASIRLMTSQIKQALNRLGILEI